MKFSSLFVVIALVCVSSIYAEDPTTPPPKDDQPTQPPKDDQSTQPPKDDQSTQPPKDDQPTQPPKDDQPTQPPKDDQPTELPQDGQEPQTENGPYQGEPTCNVGNDCRTYCISLHSSYSLYACINGHCDCS